MHRSNLAVGRIAAGITEQQAVLTNGCQVHIFMSFLAAHHARIRAHRHCAQPAAFEDAEIRFIMRTVLPVKASPVRIETVGIQHDEFAHTDQPGARPRVITPLGLDMIEQKR